MTSVEIKERLEKALENVNKKEATIERHKKQAGKKLAEINKRGIDTNPYNNRDNSDDYWLTIEYKHKMEDIESAKKKLEEAKTIAENWNKKLEKAVANEMKIANEIPQPMKDARAELVRKWVAGDIKNRDEMLEARKNLDHKEFRKRYTYNQEQELLHTDEEFTKIEEREADYWLLNLYNRVKEITGNVTECKYLKWGGKGLDGYIVGEKGKALVETIDAGGYNIQRYHLRVLVKEY